MITQPQTWGVKRGDATNIVCDNVRFKGEIRSLVASRASQLADEFEGTIVSEVEAQGAEAEVITAVDITLCH